MRETAKSPVRTKRWTRLEYERLIDLGAFAPDERLELLGGQLVVREPQGRPHATGIRLVARALRAVFGPDWNIEAQLPVALDEESEPEPDIAVVTGGPRDYIESHPSRPELVVEVALASLALDRGEKASLYAGLEWQTIGSSTWSRTSWRYTGSRWLTRTGPMAGATRRRQPFAGATR